MTVHAAVRAAAERLRRAGLTGPDAWRDAQLLAREVLAWDAGAWLIRHHEQLPSALESDYERLIDRRARREPVDRLIGRREFWGLDLEVTPAVLSPRPETELIVEEALAIAREARPSVIVDAGTGSGCLAIALAHELPYARVIATDASADAVAVARRNAARHGLAARIELRESSFLRGIDEADLVVSNPPYIATSDLAGLPPEVRDFDPAAALDGGADGLTGHRELFDAARTALKAGGHMVVEIGADQEDAVRALARDRPWLETARVRTDLQGLPRVAVLRRRRVLL